MISTIQILFGTSEAEVEYYNPNTGTRSYYDLEVEVEDNYLTVIHWNNGGWLDDDHFTPPEFEGCEARFVSYRGYEYEVRLYDCDN